MHPSGASPACCACSQGACSGASPAQLLVVAAVSLVIWEQLKDPAASGLQRASWEALLPFTLPKSHSHCSGLPGRQSLFPQGHASCQDALFPAGFGAYAVADTPWKYLPVCFFSRGVCGTGFPGLSPGNIPFVVPGVGLDLGPSSAESQPCRQWECLVWIWLRLWLGMG